MGASRSGTYGPYPYRGNCRGNEVPVNTRTIAILALVLVVIVLLVMFTSLG